MSGGSQAKSIDGVWVHVFKVSIEHFLRACHFIINLRVKILLSASNFSPPTLLTRFTNTVWGKLCIWVIDKRD